MKQNRLSTAIIGGVWMLAVMTVTAPAFAEGTPEQRAACMGDAFRFCRDDIPNVGRIVACLRNNGSRLSEPCHQVMFADHAEADGSQPRFRSRLEQ